jgi:hypothetical protein
MSNPEISRRCNNCGASIRKRTAFCPQCGWQTVAPKTESIHDKADPPKRSPAGGGKVKSELTTTSEDNKRAAAGERDNSINSVSQRRLSRPTMFANHEGAPKRHTVVNVASDAVKDGLLPKVEKIRSASHAMLDEAADDPSFRFLLVAAAIFIVFVILLFISNFLR